MNIPTHVDHILNSHIAQTFTKIDIVRVAVADSTVSTAQIKENVAPRVATPIVRNLFNMGTHV